jgi:hypothetical protein
MAEKSFSRRIAFAFLDDIKTRFQRTYQDRAHSALTFAMNDDFGRVLQKQMVRHLENLNPALQFNSLSSHFHFNPNCSNFLMRLICSRANLFLAQIFVQQQKKF